MKKSPLLTISLAVALSACAQKVNDKDVPEVVKTKFSSDYPEISNAKWEKKGSDYEARYKDQSEDVVAKYDKNGNLIEREEKVKLTVLPDKAKVYCDDNLPGKTITEAYKVTDKNGKVLYDAVVEQTEYVFDSDGKYQDKKSKKK